MSARDFTHRRIRSRRSVLAVTENDAPTLANWGGSGSTNSLIWVTSSPGGTSKPGSLSLKIYHLARDTNHVQDFTSCTNQAPSI